MYYFHNYVALFYFTLYVFTVEVTCTVVGEYDDLPN